MTIKRFALLIAVLGGMTIASSASAQALRRRAVTGPLLTGKVMRDVVVPAVPDPEPAAASCGTTLRACDAAKYCFPGTNSACVQAGFVDGQAWRACIYATEYGSNPNRGPSKGLAVGPVDFRPSTDAPWQRAIYTAGTAEIFTGYDGVTPIPLVTRLYDTFGASWSKEGGTTSYNWSLNALTPAHLPAGGKLLTLSRDAAFGSRAAAECRDRGIAWLCHGSKRTDVRRGEELVLWGVFDSANYDFLIEYGFRDDGTISFRTGATGYNNLNFGRTGRCPSPGNPSCGDIPHVHDILWRVDVDIAGGTSDAVRETAHVDGPPFARDEEGPFNGGLEGGISWRPERYTSVVIENTARVNANGNRQGYAIHPLRFGNARQFPIGEKEWTDNDIWITAWHPNENTAWADVYQTPGAYLNLYASPTGRESITATDVVLWYTATAHHDPIDEDRQPTGDYGITLAHYFGFELSPHNLFPQNPLGGPRICD